MEEKHSESHRSLKLREARRDEPTVGAVRQSVGGNSSGRGFLRSGNLIRSHTGGVPVRQTGLVMGGALSRGGSPSARCGWLQTSWLSRRAAGRSRRAEKTGSEQPDGSRLIGSSASRTQTSRTRCCGKDSGLRQRILVACFSSQWRCIEGRKGRQSREAEGGFLSGLYCNHLIKSSRSSDRLDLPDEDEQREAELWLE